MNTYLHSVWKIAEIQRNSYIRIYFYYIDKFNFYDEQDFNEVPKRRLYKCKESPSTMF